jgi:1,2-diacylglycerol 3-alpha-glucosyltransferase
MIRLFLLCSGLGHVRRGYESFTEECFAALSSHPELDISLFQGGFTSIDSAITLKNLPRNHSFTRQLANLSKKSSNFSDPYFLEQASFCFSLIPHLYIQKPDVIFFSDFVLGTMLWHWRRISRLSYKLLFSNGAPNGPPFSRMDHVQHLTPVHRQAALDAGEPASKHSLVPYGLKVHREYTPLPQSDREALRRQLHLPIDRPILLSVGTLNKSHKRMDYLVQEIAGMPEPRPYLVLLGQTDGESNEIIKLAKQHLGVTNFQINTVSPTEVGYYYQVADAFVLASLREGFGRVFLEAMAYGLPCLAHDYEVTRFVLGDNAFLGDFQMPGRLAALIPQALSDSQNNDKRCQRHQSVYQRFSWDVLTPAYVQTIYQCISANNLIQPNANCP